MATGDQQFTGHGEGPPPYRPLSGGAVTALVLALLMAFPAFLGPWWVMGLPLLVLLLSWPGVSSGRRRGKGLLWITLILTVGIGVMAWRAHVGFAKQLDETMTPLMAALDKDDRATLEKWTHESVDRPAAFDRWQLRLENARKSVGPWSGSLRFDPGWYGMFAALFARPGGLTEVEPIGDKPLDDVFGAFWIRAPHNRGDVWLGLQIGEPGKPEETQREITRWLEGEMTDGAPADKKDGTVAGPRLIRDVRVFVSTPP